VRQHPEREPEIERMQKELSATCLATLADQLRGGDRAKEVKEMRRRARQAAGDTGRAAWQGADLASLEPEEMERLLADTVLKEFETRLGRIGIDYPMPIQP